MRAACVRMGGRACDAPEVYSAVMLQALAACARANQAEAEAGRLPLLYSAPVVWKNEPTAGQGVEFIDDAVICLRRGWLDCDDAAAWRVGELRARKSKRWPHGEPASLVVKWIEATHQYHALVRRGDGSLEDPSRVKGMR